MNVQHETTVPIIIGGAHRSGTTLFRKLLNGHSRIFCPSEIKFHLDLLAQHSKELLSHAKLGSTITALGLEQREWLHEFSQAFIRCYEKATSLHGKKRWADKNPENALNITYWDEALQGKLYFILVIRHPFDIVASMMETDMLVFPKTIKAKAQQVHRYITSGLEYYQLHQERSSIVRYEELVLHTENALQKVMKDLGEEYESAMITKLGDRFHGVGLGDPKSIHKAVITSESIGRWKKSFTHKEKIIVAKELGCLSVELGYNYNGINDGTICDDLRNVVTKRCEKVLKILKKIWNKGARILKLQ